MLQERLQYRNVFLFIRNNCSKSTVFFGLGFLCFALMLFEQWFAKDIAGWLHTVEYKPRSGVVYVELSKRRVVTLFLLFFREVRLRLGPRREHEKGILFINVFKGILFINVLNDKRGCCSFSHNGDAHARVYVRPCFDIVPNGSWFSRRLIRDLPGALPGWLDFKLLGAHCRRRSGRSWVVPAQTAKSWRLEVVLDKSDLVYLVQEYSAFGWGLTKVTSDGEFRLLELISAVLPGV